VDQLVLSVHKVAPDRKLQRLFPAHPTHLVAQQSALLNRTLQHPPAFSAQHYSCNRRCCMQPLEEAGPLSCCREAGKRVRCMPAQWAAALRAPVGVLLALGLVRALGVLADVDHHLR
jgi:hypothetical protein